MKTLNMVRVAVASAFVAAGLLVGAQALAASTPTPDIGTSCSGYAVVLAHADGAVAFETPSGSTCSPTFQGSMAGKKLVAPIVGLATVPGGGGYWLVASDGGIFTFGDAQYYGSMGGHRLDAPIVGMASTPDGRGYWLVASDGGIFTFGDASFYGSMGGKHLDKPVVGMAADGATGGYWLVASDGGVFTFNAPFLGSEGGVRLNAPIKFITGTPDYDGYRMVGADGGVFNFGDAQYYGSAANGSGVVWQGLATTPDGGGYWLFNNSAGTYAVTVAPYGDATNTLTLNGGDLSVSPIVGAASDFNPTPPTVTANPVSETVQPGATATFTAAATGYPAPGVQWQVSVDQGASYFDIPNAVTPTLAFTATQSESGGYYRAVFTNGGGTVYTSSASLTVGNAPDVITQPQSQTVASGATVTFTASATGTPTPTVQWEVSSNGGSTWVGVTDGTSTTLSFAATTAENGNIYRAAFTNSTGITLTSTATLTVT